MADGRPAVSAELQQVRDELARLRADLELALSQLPGKWDFEELSLRTDGAVAAIEDRLDASEQVSRQVLQASQEAVARVAALEGRLGEATARLEALEKGGAGAPRPGSGEEAARLDRLERRLAALERLGPVGPASAGSFPAGAAGSGAAAPSAGSTASGGALPGGAPAPGTAVPGGAPASGATGSLAGAGSDLTAELAEHRERMRGVLADLAEEQEPRFRHLEERLELALHDLRARAEEIEEIRRALRPPGSAPGTPGES